MPDAASWMAEAAAPILALFSRHQPLLYDVPYCVSARIVNTLCGRLSQTTATYRLRYNLGCCLPEQLMPPLVAAASSFSTC